MGFTFTPFELPGLILVEGPSFADERGFFLENFRESDCAAAGIPPLVQENLSRSSRGVVRGLHYQKKPSAIGKLVRCVRGGIFDVAVDIRKGSPTYGKWAALELSDRGNRMLWIPEGFAHGFCALSDWADVQYKVSGYWAKAEERGILWSDPALGIPWPLENPLLSEKDARLPPLERADNNFTWAPGIK